MQDLLNWFYNWLVGDLSPTERVWTALWPGFVLVAYFLVGLLIYATRSLRRGAHRDAEVENRGSSVFLGMWVRLYFVWVMQPLWKLVRKTGIPANAVTTLSFLLAMGAGIALSQGRFALGGWLYIFSGILDFIDGRVARETGSAGPRGEALDSILDRFADSAILVGLAWFYRDRWVLLPTLFALAGSHIVPYVRARGEALGISVKVGVMQRAERIAYLGGMVAVSPVLEATFRPEETRPIHLLAVAGLVLMAISTNLTGLQRLFFLLNALDSEKDEERTRSIPGLLSRSLVAAVVATAADYALFATMVAYLSLNPSASTALGCVLGAIINFSINRVWTFRSKGPRLLQASRYSFVSLSSALLNAGGVGVLLMLPTMDHRIAWALVRAAVFLAWNFPLHRDYVFVEPDDRPVLRAAKAA